MFIIGAVFATTMIGVWLVGAGVVSLATARILMAAMLVAVLVANAYWGFDPGPLAHFRRDADFARAGVFTLIFVYGSLWLACDFRKRVLKRQP